MHAKQMMNAIKCLYSNPASHLVITYQWYLTDDSELHTCPRCKNKTGLNSQQLHLFGKCFLRNSHCIFITELWIHISNIISSGSDIYWKDWVLVVLGLQEVVKQPILKIITIIKYQFIAKCGNVERQHCYSLSGIHGRYQSIDNCHVISKLK